MTIETRLYRDDIVRILALVGLPDCALEFVESVKEWADSVGLKESNWDRLAMAVSADGKPMIVFKDRIAEDDREGVLCGMMFHGFDKELERIQSGEAFLEHLVLHEAAHLLSPERSEEECDEWAFENLDSRIPRGAA